jgi:NAD(P)-dependent dehydrogenase (short-subunit alcohol dehydrogenase family)
MPPGSAIVLTTSIANEKGMPGVSAYAAAKAGLHSLARSLAAKLLPRGIGVSTATVYGLCERGEGASTARVIELAAPPHKFARPKVRSSSELSTR